MPTRDDVLVFTSEPLREDTEVTGPVDLRLFAASTAVDTDWAATLTDVYPDGRAIHICEGICGATFRESLEHPTPIEPGKVYEYTISLWETSHVFAAGHRLRLEVTSSNFPRYARNQNTGLPLGTSAEIKIARQTIFHDAACLSHLVLPVIPAASSHAVAARPDGSWRLTANTARVRGPTLKLAVDAGVLGWWTSEQDEAEWTIDVAQAGRYQVRLNFACESAAAGNHFELIAGAGRLTGEVPATGTWYDQRELDFGAIELSPGSQSVILRSSRSDPRCPLRPACRDTLSGCERSARSNNATLTHSFNRDATGRAPQIGGWWFEPRTSHRGSFEPCALGAHAAGVAVKRAAQRAVCCAPTRKRRELRYVYSHTNADKSQNPGGEKKGEEAGTTSSRVVSRSLITTPRSSATARRRYEAADRQVIDQPHPPTRDPKRDFGKHTPLERRAKTIKTYLSGIRGIWDQ